MHTANLKCPECGTYWTVGVDEHDGLIWSSGMAQRAAEQHTDRHGPLEWHRAEEKAEPAATDPAEQSQPPVKERNYPVSIAEPRFAQLVISSELLGSKRLVTTTFRSGPDFAEVQIDLAQVALDEIPDGDERALAAVRLNLADAHELGRFLAGLSAK